MSNASAILNGAPFQCCGTVIMLEIESIYEKNDLRSERIINFVDARSKNMIICEHRAYGCVFSILPTNLMPTTQCKSYQNDICKQI